LGTIFATPNVGTEAGGSDMGHDRGKRLITRRALLRGAGALGLGAAAAPMTARAQAPMIGRGVTLTVSTWGGVTQDGVKAYVQPEFEKRTGATLAYDIGGQGARYNKLLAQRANPPADVFFSTDEAVVAGHRAGVLTPAARKSLSNLFQLHDWAQSVKEGATETTVPGVPYTLIAYLLAYNPDAVKDKPTSWADMWRPEFRDKFAFASPVHTQMPAFVILASELAGGSAANVDPGFKKLAELRPSKLTVFWTDWAPLNKSGDVTLATEFDYYLEAMKNQKYPIDYAIPKEKGFGASEYVCIVKGTKNQELAEEFLNQMLAAKAQRAFAVETHQGPISTKVELSAAEQARCACGARVDQLRFFDPAVFANNRAAWTERLNTEVVPNWRTR
jgi:putative spermidine/putrescine transport system substrate-binding protein